MQEMRGSNIQTTVEKMGLSVEEAAVYIGIKRATLYRLMSGGTIRSFHVGRRRIIPREELDRFIRDEMDRESGA